MSYANLPADKVIKACESYITARNARVLSEREEYIQKAVGQRGWFGFGKPKTREQVMADSHTLEEFEYIAIAGGYWYSKTKKLLKLALTAKKYNKEVHLEAEMADILASHFE